MASATTPRNPVENWEAVRDEWVSAVERFAADVEGWAARQGWRTLRDPKTVDEDRIAVYTVPRLVVYALSGRFLFDPVCRYVAGGTGLIDLMIIPSWDELAVFRDGDGRWRLRPEGRDFEEAKLWTEDVFVETIRGLGRAIPSRPIRSSK